MKPHLQAMNGNSSLAQRYLAVRARISRAAEAAGRSPESIRLLAVSKTFSAGAIRELMHAGQLDFGENYLQEALGKIAALADAPGVDRQPQWHFIGPIQSNKTRRIAESFNWVQSLSQEKIARRLSEQRPLHLPPLNVCLQVNVSGEASKSGCAPRDVGALAEMVASLPGIALRGLMAIPEATDDAALQSRRFGELRELFERIQAGLDPGGSNNPGARGSFDTLSMGMSADLEAAIAQGATLVRVGSALFGERPRL